MIAPKINLNILLQLWNLDGITSCDSQLYHGAQCSRAVLSIYSIEKNMCNMCVCTKIRWYIEYLQLLHRYCRNWLIYNIVQFTLILETWGIFKEKKGNPVNGSIRDAKHFTTKTLWMLLIYTEQWLHYVDEIIIFR